MVLLNIGRIVAGIADLAVIPLRDGLSPAKLKKPVRRVVEPIATIAAVWVAFAFIPWLRYSEASTGTITDRLRSTAKGLESDIKSELGTVTDKAKTLELDKLGAQAQEKLRAPLNRPSPSISTSSAPRPRTSSRDCSPPPARKRKSRRLKAQILSRHRARKSASCSRTSSAAARR